MDILVDYGYRDADCKALGLEALAEHVIRAEGKPEATEVSISFVDDEAMTELNGAYRGLEGPTDVLSFECDSIDDGFPADEGAEASGYQLGDVIIAPDVAERQCAQFGNSFQQEMELLLTHGLLHLCGYDHIEDAEAEAMEARERELLAAYRAARDAG